MERPAALGPRHGVSEGTMGAGDDGAAAEVRLEDVFIGPKDYLSSFESLYIYSHMYISPCPCMTQTPMVSNGTDAPHGSPQGTTQFDHVNDRSGRDLWTDSLVYPADHHDHHDYSGV